MNTRLLAFLILIAERSDGKIARVIRFAPSPTGAFHLGNLRTAWIAWSLAKSLHKPITLRFEDIDKPRVIPGAQKSQLADMAKLGLVTDNIQTQSDFHARHWQVFVDFLKAGLIYPCDCSRKQIRAEVEQAASASHNGVGIYTGQCRNGTGELDLTLPTLAWRLKAPHPSGCDDIVIARTAPQQSTRAIPAFESFVPAYNWACAIDDWDGQFSLLVRAWDLAEMAPPQRLIQKKLAELEGRPFTPPAIFHTALIVQNDGHRLEKRTQGITLPELLASGWTPKGLTDAFAKSFVFDLKELGPGVIVGEELRQMTMSEGHFCQPR